MPNNKNIVPVCLQIMKQSSQRGLQLDRSCLGLFQGQITSDIIPSVVATIIMRSIFSLSVLYNPACYYSDYFIIQANARWAGGEYRDSVIAHSMTLQHGLRPDPSVWVMVDLWLQQLSYLIT